tara:strand:+ start:658 stop:1347 length:690 start_codon:yes stop_codon:yes gene_type:complete
MRLFFSFILCALVGLSPLSAERTVRVLHYGAPKDSNLLEAFLYGGLPEAIPVTLNRSNFSNQIPISAETELLRVLPRLLIKDEVFPRDAPSIAIPTTWVDTLLIFFHDTTNSVMPIRIAKMNASAGVFNPGELYWINMSEVFVGGTVGAEELRIAPQKTAIMKCPTEDRECAVKLDFVVKGETSRRALIRQMWRVNKQTRQVVFILKKPAPQMASYYVLPIKDIPEIKK